MQAWQVALVIAGASALGLGVWLSLRARSALARRPKAGNALVPTSRPGTVAVASTSEIAGLFEQSLEDVVFRGDTLVVPDPAHSDLIMVFGSRDVAGSFGDIVDNVPGQLAAVAVGADTLVQAGIAVGEQSGMLVRLTRDSAEAMRELRPIKDGGGAVMGVLRDGSGKFRHVVRFKPTSGLTALSNATNLLSAVAMQAQLAAIERSIKALVEGVEQVQQTLSIQAQSHQAAVSNVLRDIYRGARASGVLTQSAWDQVSPLAIHVEQDSEYVQRDLDRLMRELVERGSTKDRRTWLHANRDQLIRALDQLARAQQAQLQFHALRLWWLSTCGDAGLAHYVGTLQKMIETQEESRALNQTRLASVLDRAEQTWWFDHAHSPIDSHKVKRELHELSLALREAGVLPSRDTEALAAGQEEPSTGPDSTSAPDPDEHPAGP